MCGFEITKATPTLYVLMLNTIFLVAQIQFFCVSVDIYFKTWLTYESSVNWSQPWSDPHAQKNIDKSHMHYAEYIEVDATEVSIYGFISK